MKVLLKTPAGQVAVEIPPETETLRVGMYRANDVSVIDIEIDATWYEGRYQDTPIAQHLISTELVPESTFGIIEDLTNDPPTRSGFAVHP